MIPITKTFFPPLSEYTQQLQRIWENEWLTNRGELVKELEVKLKDYLQVSHLTLTTNGTLPLQIALNVLAQKGEVITTAFSYVATTAAIVWENCEPVFVDIHPEYLTIDENRIEEAITEKTTAILATHVFGNPCNIEEIEKIAQKHGLKVIYDASHCFGVKYNGKSIFNYGDVSTCSFHATKIFHTAEGGAMFCNDEELQKKLFYSHNFGHKGKLDFHGLGINAKMSELQAAMGLSVLPYFEKILRSRGELVSYYDENLSRNGIQRLRMRKNTSWNCSYFPIIVPNEKELLKIQEALNMEGIYPRRYFYPSLNFLNYVNKKGLPISEGISARILCLPLFPGLDSVKQKACVEIINKILE